MVDAAADVNRVSGLTWAIHSNGYAWAWHNGRRVYLRRFLLGLQPGDNRVGDHKDGNRLNNSRRNLRLTDNSGNQMNKRKQKACSSRYKGVSWRRQGKRWYVAIGVNGRHVNLGFYESEKEAARLYDSASAFFFGPFARHNNLTEVPLSAKASLRLAQVIERHGHLAYDADREAA